MWETLQLMWAVLGSGDLKAKDDGGWGNNKCGWMEANYSQVSCKVHLRRKEGMGATGRQRRKEENLY